MTRDSLHESLVLVREAVFPPDPGSFRLIGAARATLGGVVTLLLALLLRDVMPMPFTARVMGFSIAMFLGATVRDPTRREQAWTIALSPVPLIIVITLAALARPLHHVTDLLTIAVVFVVISVTSCGPRWATLGVVSLIGLFIALLSNLSIADLPSRAAVIVLAVASAGLVRFVIIPERPAADLRRLIRTVRSDVADILSQIEHCVQRRRGSSRVRNGLHRAVSRLNDAVMLAQPRLAPDAALHLLELQVLMERLVRVATLDRDSAGEPSELLPQLDALRCAVVDGTQTPGSGQPTAELGRVLANVPPVLHQLAGDATAAPVLPSPAPRATWASADFRSGLQAALATSLAILGGGIVSPARWYWAVFSAIALFQGTRSRAETTARAWEMLIGTLAGVIAGVLIATLLAGQTALTMGVMIVCVFLTFFASTAAYAVMMFWITVILGLVFGMLGYFPPRLLLLRLEETIVGAAAGSLVAWLVLARRTPDLVQQSAAKFLRALQGVVDAAVRPLLGSGTDERLLALTFTQEQQYQSLQSLAKPRLPGMRYLGPDRLQRVLVLLGACDHWSRELAGTSLHLQQQEDSAVSAIAAQARRRIDASIAATTAILDKTSAPAASDGEEPGTIVLPPDGDTAPLHAVRLLLRLDSALLHVRQRISA